MASHGEWEERRYLWLQQQQQKTLFQLSARLYHTAKSTVTSNKQKEHYPKCYDICAIQTVLMFHKRSTGSECDTTKPATFSSWDHQTLRIKSFSYSSIGVSQTANCTTDKRLLFLSGLLGCTGDLMKADAVGSSPSQWKAISHFFHVKKFFADLSINAHLAFASFCSLKIPCAASDKRRLKWQWHGNT